MCKVLAIAGIKKGQHELVKKMATAAANEFGTSDGDGFGYAAITKTGEIYGEKWLRKEDAFVLHQNAVPPRSSLMIDNVLGEAAKLPEFPSEPTYGRFGAEMTKDVLEDTVAFMMHARKKTIGEKSIINTHPFFHPEDKKVEPTALIHNGGIRNHEKLTKMFSTCDSETILHEYLKQAVNYVPSLIEQVANTLIGEYTSIVLSRYITDKQQYQPYMDIFKSNKELYVGYVKELDNLVFCTAKYSLEAICKACGFTLLDPVEVEDGFLIRLNAITGERLEELVAFEKSKATEYAYDYRNQNQGNMVGRQALGPAASTQNTTETPSPKMAKIKKEFQENHPELFGSEYMTVEPMTDADKALLVEFEQANNGNKNLRALALVKSSIASRG